MDAKTFQDDLQSLGFPPSLAKPEMEKEVEKGRAHLLGKRVICVRVTGRGAREASDGATSRSVEAFQFGDIGNALERKPSGQHMREVADEKLCTEEKRTP